MERKKIISDEALCSLRKRVSSLLSEKRFYHVAKVEEMAAKLGMLYMPDEIARLRAAALLHDISKEYTVEKHLQIYEEYGIMSGKTDAEIPKIMHAKTAAALIPKMFPEFNDDFIVSAVRWHTTGRENMLLHEKLIFLADYIDESRTFEDCVKLRDYFFSACPEKMEKKERLWHLDDTLILAYDYTLKGLIEEGSAFCVDTVASRNYLIYKRKQRTRSEV